MSPGQSVRECPPPYSPAVPGHLPAAATNPSGKSHTLNEFSPRTECPDAMNELSVRRERHEMPSQRSVEPRDGTASGEARPHAERNGKRNGGGLESAEECPSRQTGVCECGAEFAINPRFTGEHRFCSARCRVQAWRRDKARAKERVA